MWQRDNVGPNGFPQIGHHRSGPRIWSPRGDPPITGLLGIFDSMSYVNMSQMYNDYYTIIYTVLPVNG
jgi:hypothetical protein